MPSATRFNGRSRPGCAPTIYVVDNDDAVRDSLVLLLESHGKTVKAYSSGGAFLTDYRPGHGGCLVLDLHMPELNGIDLLERFAPGALDIPAIMISGQLDSTSRARAVAAGATAVLNKPFRDQELLSAIQAALESRGA